MGILKAIVSTVGALVLAAGLGACDRQSPQSNTPMTTEEIIRRHANSPVGKSITPIVSSLAKHVVFVATDDTTTTQPTQMTLQRLRFKTAKDNEGRMWAYAYTNEGEFLRAFPQGGGFAELSFRDFFVMIECDAQFAGIFLNAGSDASYLIPRELFDIVKEVLRQPSR